MLRKGEVGEGEKGEMPAAVGGQMGNQQGWYGPPPMGQQGIRKEEGEKQVQLQQKDQQTAIQQQQQQGPPEYARDVKM